MTEEHKRKVYAYAYARVSTDDHDQNPESQLVKIRSWAKERGITIIDEFTDEATGTNRDRDGLKNLLGSLQMNAIDMDPGKVTLVIVLDADRLSRNMKDTNKILDTFDRYGVRLVYVANESLDVTTPEGMVINTIKSFGAQAYTDGHSLKIKAGQERARQEGKHIGRPLKMRTDNDAIDSEMLLIFAQKGYSLNDLGKMYRCSRNTIARELKKQGKLEQFKEYYNQAVNQEPQIDKPIA